MKKRKKFNNEKIRRGIYILPNIFTSLNIFCGFYAIVAAINGKFVSAAWVIIIAAVFDGLDGKIARATNTSSKFGVEYDSLADLISFGLAPGLMIFLWALQPLGRIGWLAGFLFMVCGALRLARFNTQTETTAKDYFVGLPIPAAAGMSATIVLICDKFSISGNTYPIFILITLYILSFFMVSTIRYNSLKKPELFKKMNFNVLVAAILIMIFIVAQPAIALFSIGVAYLVSGPVTTLRLKRNSKLHKADSCDTEEHSQIMFKL